MQNKSRKGMGSCPENHQIRGGEPRNGEEEQKEKPGETDGLALVEPAGYVRTNGE